MDPATLVGVIGAFVVVFLVQNLEGGTPGSILLVAPLILVFGGTIFAGMAGGTLKDVLGLGGTLKRAFLVKVIPPGDLVDSVVSLAERARREGLLALEDAAKEVNQPFLRRGLELAIDGTDPEELGEILQSEVDAKRKADKVGVKLLESMGGYSPTIGIIGTVMGLVHVLENLSEPEKLGHLIAGAFVATLWGVLTANIVWLPLSARLKRISEIECDQMELAIEGVLAIQAGSNPRLVAQKLRSLLPPGSAPPADKKKKAA